MRRFWEIPGVIQGACTLAAAILAGSVAVWVFLKKFRAKKLSIFVSSPTKTLEVGDKVRSRIKILYDNKPVNDLYLGIFTLKNCGHLPIEKLQVDFRTPNDITILNFQILEANFSHDKRLCINEKPSGYEIALSFLNKNERISFQYTSTGSDQKPKIDASQPGLDITYSSERDIAAAFMQGFLSAMGYISPLKLDESEYKKALSIIAKSRFKE